MRIVDPQVTGSTPVGHPTSPIGEHDTARHETTPSDKVGARTGTPIRRRKGTGHRLRAFVCRLIGHTRPIGFDVHRDSWGDSYSAHCGRCGEVLWARVFPAKLYRTGGFIRAGSMGIVGESGPETQAEP